MLRITRTDGPDGAETLKLEGKLVGPWVGALREACEDGRPPRLDLAAVDFVDAAGVGLLGELIDRGATLASCSALVAGYLHAEGR